MWPEAEASADRLWTAAGCPLGLPVRSLRPARKETLGDVVIRAVDAPSSRLRLPPPSRMGAQLSCQVLPCVPCKEKEPVQPLVVPVPLGPLGQMRCEEHGEEIYFFCETDAELLCVVCREGPSHRTHPVAVLDGAVQPYRVRWTAFWGPVWAGTASCRPPWRERGGIWMKDHGSPWTCGRSQAPGDLSLTGPHGHRAQRVASVNECMGQSSAHCGQVTLASQDPHRVWDLPRPRPLG